MRARRYALLVLLSLVTLNAVGGGIYGLSGAKSLPVAWLAGSPFPDYTIPGLVLLVVVGGAFAVATALVLRRSARARLATIAAAAILLGWLLVQVAIIGYVSFLQPLMAVVAFVALVLASDRQERPVRAPHGAPLRGTGETVTRIAGASEVASNRPRFV